MKGVLTSLAGAYAALAFCTWTLCQAWGIPFYYLGILWVAVTGITLFLFAYALERKQPKAFVWVILGGGMLRMLLGVATIVLPLSLRQPEGYRAQALQFAALFFVATLFETWFAVKRANSLH